MPATSTDDGAEIHHDERGSGDPVLLLPGQANDRHWWDPVRVDLAARHRTIALDPRGTGRSTFPGHGEWTTRRMAADAVAVLDDLGIARAHVYGTSMGGKVAQWLAIDHPDRVGALLLGCTTGGGPEAPVAGRAVLSPLAGPGADARRALAELMVTPAWLGAHPGGADAVLGDDTMVTAARAGHRHASTRHDASAELHRITAPTLVLHGTDDVFCPTGNVDLLLRDVPRAQVELFPGARHAYFLEHHRAASDAVLAFLAGHPLDG
ncbi:alpha/beta fold hydrolase [Pseudonocardia phyllosphaerae]|uniref:alpha/beta fold hydrolase n=1 Tax=Pseudonocardia phyllosphaerae TaxID=3390502 RepID=UPI00397E65CF